MSAQHRDDQAETLLFRLLREPVRGLAGMPASRALGEGVRCARCCGCLARNSRPAPASWVWRGSRTRPTTTPTSPATTCVAGSCRHSPSDGPGPWKASPAAPSTWPRARRCSANWRNWTCRPRGPTAPFPGCGCHPWSWPVDGPVAGPPAQCPAPLDGRLHRDAGQRSLGWLGRPARCRRQREPRMEAGGGDLRRADGRCGGCPANGRAPGRAACAGPSPGRRSNCPATAVCNLPASRRQALWRSATARAERCWTCRGVGVASPAAAQREWPSGLRARASAALYRGPELLAVANLPGLAGPVDARWRLRWTPPTNDQGLS